MSAYLNALREEGSREDLPREIERLAFNDALADVIAERKRQVESEGFTPKHDDQHKAGELAEAAVCYALQGSDAGSVRTIGGYSVIFKFWPWTREWWKPSTRRSNLVKAAALIIAEIERLDRAEGGTP